MGLWTDAHGVQLGGGGGAANRTASQPNDRRENRCWAPSMAAFRSCVAQVNETLGVDVP